MCVHYCSVFYSCVETNALLLTMRKCKVESEIDADGLKNAIVERGSNLIMKLEVSMPRCHDIKDIDDFINYLHWRVRELATDH